MTRYWPALLLLLPFGSLLALALAIWRRRRQRQEDARINELIVPPLPKFGVLSPAEADAMREQSRLRRDRADKFMEDSHKTATKDAERSVIRLIGRQH